MPTNSGKPMSKALTGENLAVNRLKPAYEQVAEQLRALITVGELSPGQRLPSEGDLAVMFGVGRTTVREGLRLLTSQQLLTTTRGVHGGTFVVTPDADNVSRYLEASIGLLAGTRRLSVEELLEAREFLEVPATRLATSRMDEQKKAALTASVELDPNANTRMEHSNFHVEILKASDNRMLEVMARPIFEVMRTRLNRNAAPTDFWEHVRHDHLAIYEAVVSGNAEQAEHLMSEHLGRLAVVYTSIDVAHEEAVPAPSPIKEET